MHQSADSMSWFILRLEVKPRWQTGSCIQQAEELPPEDQRELRAFIRNNVHKDVVQKEDVQKEQLCGLLADVNVQSGLFWKKKWFTTVRKTFFYQKKETSWNQLRYETMHDEAPEEVAVQKEPDPATSVGCRRGQALMHSWVSFSNVDYQKLWRISRVLWIPGLQNKCEAWTQRTISIHTAGGTYRRLIGQLLGPCCTVMAVFWTQ